jgi:hypothetical protein
MPPDSWAVQPAPTGSTRFPGTVTPVEAYDKEPEDEEGFSTVDHEKWEHSRKNVSILFTMHHFIAILRFLSLVLYTYIPT